MIIHIISVAEYQGRLFKVEFGTATRDAIIHSRQKRKVPISEEVAFYKEVSKIDPEALKLLMSNITEEPRILTTPSQHCCYNGGTCHVPTNKVEDRWCTCPANFTGPYCKKDVDECQLPNACPEHHSCKNTYGSYKCFCEEGFVKDNHQCIRKTNCEENPCMNFSDCIDKEDGRIICLCRLGYAGKRCEKKIMECDDNPCSGDEICVATPEGYECMQAS
ncbi:protocadherin Fat 1 [Caerostris darwini]|uniref:Protocadherin Fat 1 n=1 Tax=Caerostris darwini TaxID=1538125 RepID=A0AAV4M698_9ARAC|nr:protocadherin Fat 1 [Caerostris darwini]